MAIPPQYQFKLAAGSDPMNLVNVEAMTAGGRYFYAPVLIEDFILEQPGSDGVDFSRGYQRFVWQIDLWREQYDYLYTTILSNSFQNSVVFQTQRLQKASTYQIWTGKLKLPRFTEFQRNYRQYMQCPLTFSRCVFVS
jgi:hypothetical protein